MDTSFSIIKAQGEGNEPERKAEGKPHETRKEPPMKKSTNDIYPKTLKELRKIDYYDLKKLMKYDDDFFHAVVKICDEMIEDFLRIQKEIAAESFNDGDISKEEYEAVQAVVTIDDFLNCSFYGDNYEDARWECGMVLTEDFIFCKDYQDK